MTLDEILSQIEAQAGEEISPKIQGHLDKVKKLYSKMESDKERLEADIDSVEKDKAKAESETISRKKAIAKLEAKVGAMESQIETKEDELSNLQEKLKNAGTPEDYDTIKADLEKSKSDLEGLQTKWQGVVDQRKSTTKDKILKYSESPKWEKVKDFFTLPENDKKEGVLWDKWEDADAEAAFEKMSELERIEYFKEEKPFQRYDTSTNNNKGDFDYKSLKTREQVFDKVKQEIDGLNS